MLVALQTIVTVLFRAAAEHHRLVELIALLGETDVEAGRRRSALYGEAMWVMEHTLNRFRILWVGIRVLNFERTSINDDSAERQKFTERRRHFRAGIAIHPSLVFDVGHGNHRTLQTAVLADFDLLEKPLIPIHQTLIRILGTELWIRELGEEKFLLLRLTGIRHLSRDGSTRIRGERRRDQRDGCYTKHD